MNQSIQQLIDAGRITAALGLQNTHSGNLSVRDGDVMLITRSGSMKGRLTPEDIVLVLLDEPDPRRFGASTEAGTHRRILLSAGAVIHAHALHAILVAESCDVIVPVDWLGRRFLGHVPVASFENPVGSAEMEEAIPRFLVDSPAVVVRTHGPFVRGNNLGEVMVRLSVLEASAQTLWTLRLLGVAQPALTFLPDAGEIPDLFNSAGNGDPPPDFREAAADLFRFRLSPAGTGTISVRTSRGFDLAPWASVPDGLPLLVQREGIEPAGGDFIQILHREVYTQTGSGSVLLCHAPEVVVQSILVHMSEERTFIPIDAEGKLLYPEVPVLPPDTDPAEMVRAAARHKMVLIAGLGVLAVGSSLNETLHHVSSMRQMAILKTQTELAARCGASDDTTSDPPQTRLHNA